MNKEKVTLTMVTRKQVITKYGEAEKMAIQTVEYGDKWLSTFNTKGLENWDKGMAVEVVVTQNGDFLNFKPVIDGESSPVSYSQNNNSDSLVKSNSNLEERVAKLEETVARWEQNA